MNFRQVFLPYCIQRQPDGRYVVLNRDYKPLGSSAYERIDYAPFALRLKGLTSRVAARASHNGDSSTDNVFLYDDGCIPENLTNVLAYARRLLALLKVKIVTS